MVSKFLQYPPWIYIVSYFTRCVVCMCSIKAPLQCKYMYKMYAGMKKTEEGRTRGSNQHILSVSEIAV